MVAQAWLGQLFSSLTSNALFEKKTYVLLFLMFCLGGRWMMDQEFHDGTGVLTCCRARWLKKHEMQSTGKINPGYLLRKIEKQKSSWKKKKTSQSSAVKMTSGVVSNHPLSAGIMHFAFHFWEVFTQEDSWRGCSNSFHHQAAALVANTNLLLLSFLSQGRRINKIPTAGHVNFLSGPVAIRNGLERSRGWVEISEPCCNSQNLILALLCQAAPHRVKGWLKM